MAHLTLTEAHVRYPVFSGSRNQSILTAAAEKASFGRLRRASDGIFHVHALRGINLELRAGARVGLVGRNGSGKSTLLKTLAGINAPDRGTRDAQGTLATVLTVGSGIDPEKSGRRNVEFIGRLFGLSSDQIATMTEDVHVFTELGRFYEMPVRTYSTGMSVRLSFAIATALGGEILLVDEILAAGDLHFLANAADRFKARLTETKIFVFASHSDAALFEFCDDCLWLDAGQVVAAGPVREVWQAYCTDEIPPELVPGPKLSFPAR